MAKYETIQYGSSGDAVRQLQELLKQQGYHVTVDGSFGSQTQQAVRNYQRENGLTADGVAGDQTWTSLTDYEPSQQTRSAREELDRITDSRPGDYESPYAEDLEALYDQIMNRKDFSYDPGTDPMYLSYRDQYRTQGRLAMEDTMGKAAGLTGGYGSSYAQAAGQQAYNGYLTEFGSVAQELYRMALDQYNRRGQDMLDRYGMLRDLENDSYGRYRDSYDRWQDEYFDAMDRYDRQQELDYERYQDMLKYWQESGQSGSSSGSKSSSTGNAASGSKSEDGDSPDYSAIKSLARQYMESGGSDPLGSDEMLQWMAEQGLTGRSAELFLEALELLGYDRRDTGGSGGGRVIRDDKVNHLN